jgi:hypothetical protein
MAKNTPLEWLRQNKYKFENDAQLRKACALEFGISSQKVYDSYANFKKSKNKQPKQPIETIEEPCKPVTGLTESQLRAKHDIDFIIKSKAKELKIGVYVAEHDFIKMCCLHGSQGYRQVLDGLHEYKGRAGGITYYSHPDSIRKMKIEGILS